MTDPKMEAFEKALNRLEEKIDEYLDPDFTGDADDLRAARAAVLTLYEEALRPDSDLRDYLEEEASYLNTEAAGPINKRAREVMLGVSARLLARCAAMTTDAPITEEEDCGHGAFNPGCDLCDKNRAEFRDRATTGDPIDG